MKGTLLKKNKFMSKQARVFELYANGEMKYYKDSEYKGSITLLKDSEVTMPLKNTLKVVDKGKKGGKEYELIIPDKPVKDETPHTIDDWVKHMKEVIQW